MVIGVCYFSLCSLLPYFFPVPNPHYPLSPEGAPSSPVPSPQSPLPLIPRGGPEFPSPQSPIPSP
ncbi:hypothetical protein FDUTEX481_08385 [Tolypothrix sp. PCC 7601]|nr:hypothetical protein FDUTEX481_08385 [Tolypothrix sp. PCC 7601]